MSEREYPYFRVSYLPLRNSGLPELWGVLSRDLWESVEISVLHLPHLSASVDVGGTYRDILILHLVEAAETVETHSVAELCRAQVGMSMPGLGPPHQKSPD